MQGERLSLLLVASSGGHLAHLWWLRPWWAVHRRRFVTFDTPDARERLVGEEVVWAHHPTNRDPVNLVRNLGLAMRTLVPARVDVVVSAGAGVGVPFLAVGRLTGAATVHLEVGDRVQTASWTTRIVAPWVDAVVVPSEATRRSAGVGVVLGPMR